MREEGEDVAGDDEVRFANGDGSSYMTASEEDAWTRGAEYSAAGPQFPLSAISPPAPEQRPVNQEAFSTAKADLASAQRAAKQDWETMRETRKETHRVRDMISGLEEEYPELAGTVRCYTKRQYAKRKAETLDADARFDERTAKRRKVGKGAPEELRPLVAAWHAAYRVALADTLKLSAFPEPPAWPCDKRTRCDAHKDERLLGACKHNIKAALASLSKWELKRCKVLFHPDRFHICRAEKRDEWRRMAEEVFVVVGRESDKRRVGEERVEMTFGDDEKGDGDGEERKG